MATSSNRNDVAAIHVLKGKLRLSEDDYRALLRELTGLESCRQMQPRQLQAVRAHFDGLVARMAGQPQRSGRLTPAEFQRKKTAASPQERKVWALWNQLHRDGLIDNPSEQALHAWVFRQVRAHHLKFCGDFELRSLIEALKRWGERGEEPAPGPETSSGKVSTA